MDEGAAWIPCVAGMLETMSAAVVQDRRLSCRRIRAALAGESGDRCGSVQWGLVRRAEDQCHSRFSQATGGSLG